MTSPKNPSRKSVERFENEGGTTRAGELARKSRPPDFRQRAKTIMDIATGAIPEAQGKAPPQQLVSGGEAASKARPSRA